MSYNDRPPIFNILRHYSAMRSWDRWKPRTKYERVITLRTDMARLVGDLDAWLTHYKEYGK